MPIDTNNPAANQIGTGEFQFCKNATTLAETLPPAGWEDFGNVDVFQPQITNETYEHERSHRGKKVVDRKYSIKQGSALMLRCDDLTRANVERVFMGEDDGEDNARGALTDSKVELAFTALVPSVILKRYDLVVSDEQAVHLTSALVFAGTPVSAVTADTGDTFTDAAHGLANGDRVMLVSLTTTTGASIETPYYVVGVTADTFQLSATEGGAALALTTNGTATYLAALTEDTDYEIDLILGQVRFLAVYDEDAFVFVTGAAITSADDEYMRFVTALEDSAVEGFGRFVVFHSETGQPAWTKQPFPCTITPQNFSEQTGKSVSTFEFMVQWNGSGQRIGVAKRAI